MNNDNLNSFIDMILISKKLSNIFLQNFDLLFIKTSKKAERIVDNNSTKIFSSKRTQIT